MSLETVWEDALGEGYVYLPNHPSPGTSGRVTRSIDMFTLDANLQ